MVPVGLLWGLQAPTSLSCPDTDLCTPCHLSCRCRQMTYSDDLPQISVVFIFVNEALSVILRSVHSVVNHTPSQLLKEVILVDDNSDNGEWGQLSTPAKEACCSPGAQNSEFRVWPGPRFLQRLQERVPPASPSFCWLLVSLVSWACGHTSPISASIFTRPLLVYLSLSSSYKDLRP